MAKKKTVSQTPADGMTDEEYALYHPWCHSQSPNENGQFEVYALVEIIGPDGRGGYNPGKRAHVAWVASLELARLICINNRVAEAGTNLVGAYDRMIQKLETSKEALAFEEAWGHNRRTRRRITERRLENLPVKL